MISPPFLLCSPRRSLRLSCESHSRPSTSGTISGPARLRSASADTCATGGLLLRAGSPRLRNLEARDSGLPRRPRLAPKGWFATNPPVWTEWPWQLRIRPNMSPLRDIVAVRNVSRAQPPGGGQAGLQGFGEVERGPPRTQPGGCVGRPHMGRDQWGGGDEQAVRLE